MDTQKVATQYRLSQWAKVIQARQESGQNIKDFCQAAFPSIHFSMRCLYSATEEGLDLKSLNGMVMGSGYISSGWNEDIFFGRLKETLPQWYLMPKNYPASLMERDWKNSSKGKRSSSGKSRLTTPDDLPLR